MAGRRTPTPQAGTHPIDSGTCRIVRDADGQGWLVEINGVQSSHIDLDDPLRLEFEYMRQMVAVIEARHASADPLRVLHLGAGACTLPRYLIARFPQSRQVAVDVDGALATLMREQFDLPRAPLLRIRVGDARAVVESLSDHSRDIVIRDVFAGALTPRGLTTTEFTEQVRRVLRPGGLYLLNCADTRDLTLARSEISTVAAQFASVAMIADPAMFKGRRYGNLVIAATDGTLSADPGLVKDLLAGAVPAQIRMDAREFAAGMPALHDQN
ncbi:fused MFS/spermidine synthase [Williamsia sp. CHRR-6]|uniref:spermidine synthase n=1 Tax=Williamsia sp. CHRR-6 TaxID=2835871 RepID=UPI001BDA62A8|nr:fused MFS/spermidine synthase [Williamsia sp. CHRR-6]